MLRRPPIPPLPTTRIRLAVAVTVLVFWVVLLVGTGLLLQRVRNSDLSESEAQVTRFVAGAQTAMNRVLLGVDVLLASTDELLGLSQPQGLWRQGAAASALLRSTVRYNLLLRYVVVLDAQGQVLASSAPADTQLALALAPDFVRQTLAQPVASMWLSRTQVHPDTAERMLYAARPVLRADGSRWLVLAQIPLAMLEPVLMQGADIEGLEVTLEGQDGNLLLAVPPPPGPLGQRPPLQSGLQWQQPARLSKQPALLVAQPSLYPQLWISASLPESDALTGSRAERQVLLAVALLLGILVLLAGLAVQRYVLRLYGARSAMTRAKATLDQALGAMVSGFLLVDGQQRVLQWNLRFEELFPWLRGVIAVGQSFAALLHLVAEQHLAGASESERHQWVQWRLQRMKQAQGLSFEQFLPSGLCIEVTERPTPEGGCVITYHDVTALRRANAEIENLAFYDPLTSLPNRRLLLDRLGQAILQAQRTGQRGALLFLDLDHFKMLNDTRGHEVGDQLLQQVAQRLKECVRSCDTVARLGGDEFVVMLSELAGDCAQAAAQARQVGEKLLLQLAQPYTLSGQPQRSSCSMGAAVFGAEAISAAELLKRADIAMYQSKALRGNALSFFDPQMQEALNRRASLEADLQAALLDSQLQLHYQPQYHLGGALIGAEALLRWQHPTRGMVGPGEFIAVAEESGLILPLGAWVLQRACQQLAAWQQSALRGLPLSVNVSARQFRQGDFTAQVLQLLDASGAPAHLLKLELTESLVLEDVQDSIAKMHALRTRGVRFAMDDFGTGHSSLAYLTQLPLDQLKIDQSFVRQLGLQHSDDVIVQTIIAMARTLELEVIAEGVETAAQRDALAGYGCQLYQGYLYARPLPAAQLLALAAPPAAAAAVSSPARADDDAADDEHKGDAVVGLRPLAQEGR